MPEITVYMNCDTRLAINLAMFELSDKDEFIFAIKNYNYLESGYVYLFRARSSDIDANGEVIFKITPEVSKLLKPGAFYNFAILTNAFDPKASTEYKKLTDNGDIRIEYGAQDLLVKPNEGDEHYDNIDNIRLEHISDDAPDSAHNAYVSSKLAGLRLEEITDV